MWLPIRREDDAVLVLIDNPQDLQRVDAIYQLLRGQQIKLAVGLRKDIDMLLAAAGGDLQSKDSIGNIISDLGNEAAVEREELTGAAGAAPLATTRATGAARASTSCWLPPTP